jgi:CheY-like chemotaxis protein
MPVMDGLTMCRKIRQEEDQRNWPPIPVISLSAHAMTEGWAQASDAGFSHYCGKPVNFRDLGHEILELTDPNIPHKFLRDRPKPRALLKLLGQLPEDDDDDDDEEQEGTL